MKLILAPIRGITDCIYRQAHSNFFGGFDEAVAPFVASMKGKKIKRVQLFDILPENNRNLPVIPQILSKDENDFLSTAEEIFALGYEEINWNLGCPTPMVANKKRGSGLLPDAQKIGSILQAVTGRFPGKISVKMRLGRRSCRDIFNILPILNDLPLKRVMIHPRLGIQMYKGCVDLDIFSQCVPILNHPPVYNGDIVDVPFFTMLVEQYPSLSGWMIGRGVLWNPLLAQQLRGREVHPSRGTFLAFHDHLFARYSDRLYGSSHILGRMKGIWTYFAHIFVDHRSALKRITKSQTIQKYKDAVSVNFEREQLVFLEYTA